MEDLWRVVEGRVLKTTLDWTDERILETSWFSDAPEKGSKKKDDEQKLSEETVDEPDKEYPCLVRSVMGKSKISTLVQPNDTDRFHEAYTNIIKMHMDALKKKERPKKAKKAKKIAA
ncbi:hypothetical protein HK102_000868 [Quaeritorhiza haematococci]|nr:hypothetical protein HK102_000868 [Quaeritorhiza haematococci]